MKKVLIVSTLEISPWGGSEELWYTLAGSLMDKGIDVSVDRVAWPVLPSKMQEVINKGAHYYPRPNPHIVTSPLALGFRIRNKIFNNNYSQNLQRASPDFVIFSLGGTFESLLLKYYSYIAARKIPYFLISQYTNEFLYLNDKERELYRDIFAGAEKVYFVSGRNKEVAERTLCTDLPNAVLIYSPAVVDKDFDGAFPKSEVALMAVASRLDVHFKGQDVLLQALSTEKWKQRAWHLNIYGEGDHKAYLECLVQYYRLEPYVTFRGFSKKVEDIWQENQILIMPSHSEGTPISLMQACYCSRAAVVTDVGGNAEIISHGATGFVADAPTVHCLDKALEEAYARRAEWEDMGRRSKARVEKIIPERHYNCILDFVSHAVGK